MEGLSQAIAGIEARSLQSVTEGNDWYIASDGLIHCKTCGKARQYKIPERFEKMGGHIVGVVCDCQKRIEKEALEAQKRYEESRKMQAVSKEAFRITSLSSMTFGKDDRPNSESSKIVKQWTVRFEAGKIRKWLFLTGDHDSGKTFYAACIVNYLLAKGFNVKMSTPADIEADFWDSKDRLACYDKYAGLDLLVIDDLSVAMTSNTAGIVYKIISDRDTAGKAIVFTTAMSAQDQASPPKGSFELIMKKIWARGYPYEVEKRSVINNGGF